MNQATFADYPRYGLAICPIPLGQKGPKTEGWNQRANAITTPEAASLLTGNAGLLHAYSDPPTAALDIDDVAGTINWFQKRGIDLESMLSDVEMVHLLSGRENRDKILFRLKTEDQPLTSIKVTDPADPKHTIFELRCGSKDGMSVQDVLPPSIHPGTGEPYYWSGDWRNLPTLPDPIKQVWQSLLDKNSHTKDNSPHNKNTVATSYWNPFSSSLIVDFDKIYGKPEIIKVWLEACGYKYSSESGGMKRFLWPGSTSGSPGVVLFQHNDDRWRVFSHHGGDPLADGKPHDALDVASILQFGGDRNAALAAFDAERDPRPKVRIMGGDLNKVARTVCELLGIHAPPIVFQLGGVLVRVAILQDALEFDSVTIPKGSTVLVHLTMPDLKIRIMDAVRIQKTKIMNNEEVYEDIDCPANLATSVLSMKGNEWRFFKPLISITDAPIIRGDGYIHEDEGYDPESRLYYDGSAPKLTYLNGHPSRDDAILAAKYLLDPFRQFPFSLPTDQSVLLALLITLLLRPQLPLAPMFAIGATMPGSGKGLVIESANILVRGRLPATMCVPTNANEEELRKAITSILLKGVPAVHMDNWVRPIGGPVYNSLLTSQTWTDRILGVNVVPDLPNRCTWMASGNSLSVIADQIRRTLYLNIDPQCERPESRKFEGLPLIECIREDRQRLLSALFTILRSYRQAGCPGQNDNLLGSFEKWSQRVAAPIRWIGFQDPIESQEVLRVEDPERQKLESVFEGLIGVFQNRSFNTSDISNIISQTFNGSAASISSISSVNQALKDSIASFFQVQVGKDVSKQIGWFLRRYKGMVISGIRLDTYHEPRNKNEQRKYFVKYINQV